jgi:tetratricopeptide (TPR) repeat protein
MESEEILENLTYRRIRREYEEAEECFDKAIELAPKHAQAYYNRAVLNAEMNNFNQAIDDCKNMLALNPELYEPNAFMGWCYLRSGNIRKAFQCYHRAFHLHPADLHVIYSIVRLLFKQGFYDHLLEELVIVIDEVSKKFNDAKESIEKAKADPYFNCLVAHYEKDKENSSKLLGLAYRFRCEAMAYITGVEAKADFDAAAVHLKEAELDSIQHILFEYDHAQIRKEARDLIKAVLCSRMKSASDFQSLSRAAEKYSISHPKIALNIEEMRLLSMAAIHKQIGMYDKNPKYQTVTLMWSKIQKDARFTELFADQPWRIIKAVALFDGGQHDADELYDLLTLGLSDV